MPRAGNPTVQGLMISRMDSMETNLTGHINEVKHELAEKIGAVEQRVIVQNSRIGKCETRLDTAATIAQTEANVAKRYSGRTVVTGIVTAGFASPALIKLIEALLAWLKGQP